jgi:hypothetical protein
MFKPWRTPGDLKRLDQSWTDALEEFLSTACNRLLDIIDNMEHQHESRTAAEEKQSSSHTFEVGDIQSEEFFTIQDQELESGPRRLSSLEITQEMVDKAQRDAEDHRDVVYGTQAIKIGHSKGIFDAHQQPIQPSSKRATNADIDLLKSWQARLEDEVSLARGECNTTANGLEPTTDCGNIEPISDQGPDANRSYDDIGVEPMHERPIDAISVNSLFPEQQRAFGIVQWHLSRTLYAQITTILLDYRRYLCCWLERV